jgi:hypothetical protein
MVKNTTKTKTSSQKKQSLTETEEPVKAELDVFTFIKAISTKKNVISLDEENIKKYDPFMINKAFSLSLDTVMYANEMNAHYNVSKPQHYDYFINSNIRPRNRYEKWPKKIDNQNLELIKEYYKYSDAKARTALSILGDKELAIIKQKLEKGGIAK